MEEGGRRGGQSDETWEGLDLPLLASQMEEEAMGQGKWVASRSRKRQENRVTPEASREEHRPDNILILAQ